MTEFTKEDISYLSDFSDREIVDEITFKEQELGYGTPRLHGYTPEILRVFVTNREFLENQLEREER